MLSVNRVLLNGLMKAYTSHFFSWWHHQMETFPRYWPFMQRMHRSPVDFLHKDQWRGAVMFFFHLCLNKRLSKQTWGWWFETPWSSLWYHCNIQCLVALSLELLHNIWELMEFTKSTHVQAETWFNHLILAARIKIKMPLQARQIVTWFLVISFREVCNCKTVAWMQ